MSGATYQGLINLRKNNHALRTSNIDFFHEDPESKVLAYSRWNDEGSRVAVVINFSGDFLKDYAIAFPHEGTWHEWTKDYRVEVKAQKLAIDLGGYEAQVFLS